VTLFLGGWQVPYLHALGFSPLTTSVLQIVAFVLKVAAVLFFYIWIRWTIPRFRYDQLMNLGWKIMLPLSLLNIAVTGAWMLLML
jgi:NADH-quinone oxidoreductase subunit H